MQAERRRRGKVQNSFRRGGHYLILPLSAVYQVPLKTTCTCQDILSGRAPSDTPVKHNAAAGCNQNDKNIRADVAIVAASVVVAVVVACLQVHSVCVHSTADHSHYRKRSSSPAAS